MAKKILIFVVILIMSLGIFSACANNYDFKETDFRLTLVVDKDEASIGDKIVATAKFENLSGRAIKIKISPWDNHKKHEIKDLIDIIAYTDGTDYTFATYLWVGRKGKRTIKKDGVYIQTLEFNIDEQIDYNVISGIYFYTGKNYEGVRIYSETKTIKVI